MTNYDDGYGQPRPQVSFPPLTLWVRRLMIANVTVFVFLAVVGLGSLGLQDGVLDFFGLDPDMWRSLIPALWQLGTYAFLHDMGGLGHLLFNMLVLYFFGTMLEGIIGGRRFITHYMGAAIAGATLHLVVELAMGRSEYPPAIGASGAVMGVVVATATLRPHTQVLFIFIPVKLWVMAALYVASDLYPLLRQLSGAGTQGNVAHLIHLGGALYGFLGARYGLIMRDPIAGLERKRAVAAAERSLGDRQRLDTLLEKINREGIGSLSRAEKAFLKKASARGRQS